MTLEECNFKIRGYSGDQDESFAPCIDVELFMRQFRRPTNAVARDKAMQVVIVLSAQRG